MNKKNKKKEKHKKHIFLIIILVILITIAILYDVYRNIGSGEYIKTIQNYMGYIEKGQFENMYEMLSDESKEKITKEEFILRNKNIYEGIEARNIKISNITVNKEESEITYKTTMNTIAGRLDFRNSVKIYNNGDIYKINWCSAVIFPELKDESYKIKIANNKAKRGNIVDRNGNVLAYDGKASSIGLVPGKMSKEKQQDIAKISDLLGVEIEFIDDQLSQEYVKDDTFVPIRTIKKNETELKEELLKINGIMITDKDVRIYPYEKSTSQLLGYVQTISQKELEENQDKGYTVTSLIGKTGIEKEYESTLHGIDGYEIYIENEKGNKIKSLANKKSKDGKNIKLTIDSSIQQEVYDELKEEKSASVIINPETGEILALISTPTFDSNDFSLEMTNKMWKDLNEDVTNPLFNRFTATFVPGSTLKPIIGAIGLNEKIFTENEDFGHSEKTWKKDESWGDFKVTTLDTYSGEANLRNAMIYSDNIYFAKAALKIGSSLIEEYANKIGFGEDLKIMPKVEISQLSNNGKISSEKQLASTGYGQAEVLVNPIFMASMYSAFLNKGNMIKPYLEYSDKKDIEYLKEGVFTKEVAEIIKKSLVQVVEDPEGTGRYAKIDNMKIGGKTGTAEIKKDQNDEDGTEIGWFNAFVTDENDSDSLLIVTMIEDVKEKNGSHYTVEKVKNIIERICKK